MKYQDEIKWLNEDTVLVKLTRQEYEKLLKKRIEGKDKEREDRWLRKYFSPSKKRNPIHTYDAMRYKLKQIDQNKVIEMANSMPYDEYLQTLYWKIVRKEMLSIFKCCEECGEEKKLHIHHLFYEYPDGTPYRGQEYLDMRGLKVLCEECHGKAHNK